MQTTQLSVQGHRKDFVQGAAQKPAQKYLPRSLCTNSTCSGGGGGVVEKRKLPELQTPSAYTIACICIRKTLFIN